VATNVIMPALGMAQETGKVLRWLKRQGDAVTKGEPLLEIETDKATVELEAPESGTLAQVSVAEGETVPVGRVIARILAPGETGVAPLPAPGPVASPALPSRDTPAPARSAAGAPTAAVAAAPVAPSGRVPASPKARRLAKERGVDLAALAGSGPAGAVLADDVLMAQAAPAMSTVWRLMAERTTHSWTTVPHFFLMREVAAAGLIAWRDEQHQRSGAEITYTDLLIALVAAVLRDHPRANARWEHGAVVLNAAINVGLAVATQDGLVVPVIHGADDLSVNDIATQRRDLVGRARAGRLRPPDLMGGTFTISNLGMYAIDAFTAIINAPQAAILAVGRIADRVVPVDGHPAVRPMLITSLSCDHRVLDGARAAQFLEALAHLIEAPTSLHTVGGRE
jgi:pyruvate dehydrogenase E2 component (dihydrolipoamide acetyltransferase)